MIINDDITLHLDVMQGTDEWHELRRGIITASEMHRVLTPKTLKPSNSEKSRGYLFEKLTERITKRVDVDTYQSDAMMQGNFNEKLARDRYRDEVAGVEEVGFITRTFNDNEIGSFVIGYSPDGLVGDDGAIEVKSRDEHFQVETIIANEMPDDFLLQVHTGLLVADLEWIDFISYCGGLPMLIVRVMRDRTMDAAIIDAARAFYRRLHGEEQRYNAALRNNASNLYPTERKRHDELTGADVDE